ncbi:MAG: ComEA family DNA-binding protein [Defluviitaleaceae bacterium]|nr:ComEA family DNA-binding protein [Defluviitaleaceae bacterium]
MDNRALEFIKDNKYIILGVLCLLAVGVIYIIMQGSGGNIAPAEPVALQLQYTPQPEYEPQLPTEAPEETPEPIIVAVHVVGEVYHPGLVWLPYGSRVDKAISLAGGHTASADMLRVNIAAVVHDAMQIIVPAEGEEIAEVFIFAEPPPQAAAAPGAANSGLVNINTATSQELQTLPNIGDALSRAIIDFRETHGLFSCIEELINVPRIGERTMDSLRPLVTI